MKTKTSASRRRVILVASWAIVTALYAALIIRHVVAGPRVGDAYAYTVTFQVFAFVYYRLPPLLILLAGILLIDWVAEWSERCGARAALHWAIVGAVVSLVLVSAFWLFTGFGASASNSYDRSLEFQVLRFLRVVYPVWALVVAGFMGAIGWGARRHKEIGGGTRAHAS